MTALTALFMLCAMLGVFASVQPLPESPGKDTFESVCSLCHDGSAAVMGKQWSRAQWEAKVTEMLQEEPDVTREERAAIVEYLSANFKPGGMIYVNKASPKDLETLLDLVARDAETFVRYRTEHGAFKTVADVEHALKSVGGNAADRDKDAARLAATKDRLVF